MSEKPKLKSVHLPLAHPKRKGAKSKVTIICVCECKPPCADSEQHIQRVIFGR